MATIALYPISPKDDLKKQYVGRSIKDVPGPAAVMDVGKVRNNCKRMLEACEQLRFGWRAHVKTHKTTELTRLQVGEIGPVNLIVSTLSEAEHLVPLLVEYKKAGRTVNLLYSLPVTPAAVERLSRISSALGPGCLSLMIDHVDQLPSVTTLHRLSGVAPLLFLKIDMGGHRAGVAPQTEACSQLLAALLSLHSSGTAQLLGLYSHAGHSYSSNSRATALDFLRQELEALLVVATFIHSRAPGLALVLSVGATPTTNSVRNLLIDSIDTPPEESKAIAALRATIDAILIEKSSIELHAGVYPTLDVQQLATHALPTEGPHAQLTWDDIAFTIVAEVASLYPARGKSTTAEALVGAGSLALGRETCKAYGGWAIVSPWNRPGVSQPTKGPEHFVGWIVGRVSQEHGILTWSGEGFEPEKLEVGQKVRLWPNHSCIAASHYGWYYIVDGDDEIVDIWPRWRGW